MRIKSVILIKWWCFVVDRDKRHATCFLNLVCLSGENPEKNLTGFQLPTINYYEYIYDNFRVSNICEFLILGLFVKSTILNIKKKSAVFRPNSYSHRVV